MKRIHIFGLVILLTLFAVNTALAQDDEPEFTATLMGSAEVPGPGDEDGAGNAELRINKAKSEVCFTLSISNIGNPTAAHIHEAPIGEAGDAVITLTPLPTEGATEENVEMEEEVDCVSADAGLLERIIQNPENFYVNVHNDDFPDGAIRGQLVFKEAD